MDPHGDFRMHVILIGIGGFAGAIARYAIDGWVSQRTAGQFPFGTLVVNLSGSLLIGALFALALERGAVSAEVRGPLLIGFVGAYTTFSTLMLESWRLMEDGAWILAAGNLVGSVALGLVAVIGGLAIGRAL
jgi:CrcB protein